MTAIYEKLKTIRERTGLQQRQIADYLGVTQSFISEVEAGERPFTVEQLENIANLYGYSLAAFVDMERETYPIQFAFSTQNITQNELMIIADINKIVINSRFMAKMLKNHC